jgi:hypothetical protein
MEIVNFIIRVIALASALACAGTLVETTLSLRKEALKASQTGIISLGKWNRSLNEPPRK